MTDLEFSISIEAPAARVWHCMFDPLTYRAHPKVLAHGQHGLTVDVGGKQHRVKWDKYHIDILTANFVLHPDWFEPHAGLDESGKGDFFGPVIAATVIAHVPRTPSSFCRPMVPAVAFGRPMKMIGFRVRSMCIAA